jgi:hypothetical protein
MLAATIYIGWIIPQFAGLLGNNSLPANGWNLTAFAAFLCLGALMLGYIKRTKPFSYFLWELDYRKLTKFSILASLVGAFFYYQASRLSAEANFETGGQWSGLITIFVFFGSLLSIGLALALVTHLNVPSKVTLLVVLFDVLLVIDRIIVQGKRSAIAELALIFLMSYWYCLRKIPPRLLIVACLGVGMLYVNSTSDYRKILAAKEVGSPFGVLMGDILSIDFVDNFIGISDGKKSSYEVENAIYKVASAYSSGNYDFGFTLLNTISFNFVPAQIVGKDVKDFLSINMSNDNNIVYSREIVTGSTSTGIGDSFESYWFFGCLIFFFIGLLLNKLNRSANIGNVSAQLLIILLMTSGMHAITHTTHLFVVRLIYLAIFLIPMLWWSKKSNLSNVISSKDTLQNPDIQ